MAAEHPISVRVDTGTRTALEMTAGHLDTTVSSVLRLAVDLITHMTDEELAEALKCRACGGTGRRRLRSEEQPDAH